MLSRALGVATAMLAISIAIPAQAQNLEAGKSPSQIFSGSCAACHKSPRGLLKSVAPGSLPGFLRQHYTTSTDMASQLSAYVISNGANDPRGGGLTRQGRDLVAPRRPVEARPEPAPSAPPAAAAESPSFFNFGRKPAEPAQEAARPDAEPPMTARQKRAADRAARRLERQKSEAVRPADAERPAAARPAVLGEPPVPIEGEPVGPRKQKPAKKGRRGQEEPPKAEPVKDEPKVEPKPEPARAEPVRPEPPKEDIKPAPVKPEARPEPAPPEPKSEPAPPLRADPVPPVTPAPKPEPESRPAAEPSAPAAEPTPAPRQTPDDAAPSTSGDK